MVNPHQKPEVQKALDQIELQHKGASFLKYQILTRNDQKVLVPIRYSIRN